MRKMFSLSRPARCWPWLPWRRPPPTRAVAAGSRHRRRPRRPRHHRQRDRHSPAYAYPRTYYPVAGYEPYAYGAAPAYGCPGGYWARRPVRDPYGNVVGWSRPRFFCPAGDIRADDPNPTRRTRKRRRVLIASINSTRRVSCKRIAT